MTEKNEIQIVREEHIKPICRPEDYHQIMAMCQAASRSSELDGCLADTVRNSIIDAVSLKLSPHPVHGEVYFYSRNKKDSAQKVCVMHIGYRGMIQIAARSGWRIQADLVFANDNFLYQIEGALPILRHSFDPFKDRGALIGAYATAVMVGQPDTFTVEVVPLDDLNKAREIADKKTPSPAWKNWTAEMQKKFCIRRLWKRLPLSLEMKAIEAKIVEDEDAPVYLPAPEKPAKINGYEVPPPLLAEDAEIERMRREIATFDVSILTDKHKATMKREGGEIVEGVIVFSDKNKVAAAHKWLSSIGKMNADEKE